MKEYQEYADLLEMDLSEFLLEFVGDEEMLVNEVTDAVNDILVSQAIAHIEGFEVTDKNYGPDGEEMAADYGYTSLREYESDYGKSYVMLNLICKKASDFLYENAVVEEVSLEEYYRDQNVAVAEDNLESDGRHENPQEQENTLGKIIRYGWDSEDYQKKFTEAANEFYEKYLAYFGKDFSIEDEPFEYGEYKGENREKYNELAQILDAMCLYYKNIEKKSERYDMLRLMDYAMYNYIYNVRQMMMSIEGTHKYEKERLTVEYGKFIVS